MIRFKEGDKVKLIDNSGINAECGALAIVVGYVDNKYSNQTFTPEWLIVKWINSPLRKGQMNGGYNPEDFRCADKGKRKCKKCKDRLSCITS